MSDIEILSNQISDQILGLYNFDVSYTDAENEVFRVADGVNGYYAWPLFCKPKAISRARFDKICEMVNGFVRGTEVRNFSLESGMSYDDFMDAFYNSSMTIYEYRSARNVLHLSVPEWCALLGIALDTHKNYSAGRRPIALPVQRHIETLLKGKKTLIK